MIKWGAISPSHLSEFAKCPYPAIHLSPRLSPVINEFLCLALACKARGGSDDDEDDDYYDDLYIHISSSPSQTELNSNSGLGLGRSEQMTRQSQLNSSELVSLKFPGDSFSS